MEEHGLSIKDIISLSEEVIYLRKQWNEELKRNIELSNALCDMLFVFTCFEEHGIEKYPEQMQKALRDYNHKAREAFVGRKLTCEEI